MQTKAVTWRNLPTSLPLFPPSSTKKKISGKKVKLRGKPKFSAVVLEIGWSAQALRIEFLYWKFYILYLYLRWFVCFGLTSGVIIIIIPKIVITLKSVAYSQLHNFPVQLCYIRSLFIALTLHSKVYIWNAKQSRWRSFPSLENRNKCCFLILIN